MIKKESARETTICIVIHCREIRPITIFATLMSADRQGILGQTGRGKEAAT